MIKTITDLSDQASIETIILGVDTTELFEKRFAELIIEACCDALQQEINRDRDPALGHAFNAGEVTGLVIAQHKLRHLFTVAPT